MPLSAVLNNPSHSTSIDSVLELPEGVAGKISACNYIWSAMSRR
jgi:hypothetical protein